MSDVKILSDLIDRIRTDYQFDSDHEDYMGFLNVDPTIDWTTEEFRVFKYFYESKSTFLEGALAIRGLEIESFHDTEIVFIMTEDPFNDRILDRTEWQGRTQKQIETNEKIVMGSLTVLLLSILLYITYTLIK